MTWPYDVPASASAPVGSGSPQPRISIVTPSFNQGRFIESTILSVLNQGYDNVEHIIFDNCSTDETAEVLRRYEGVLSKVVIEPDTGQSNALNKGFRAATGDILTWLNSDDMLAPGALEQMARAFRDGGSDLVAGTILYMNEDVIVHEHIPTLVDGPLGLANLLDIDNNWLHGRYFYQPEVFFTREVFERAGGYVDESLYYSMDFDLWARMAAAGATIQVIGAPITIFRAHADQKTSGPDKYLPELRRHATALRERFNPPAPTAVVSPTKLRRIAFVNDVPEGGAALAHRRLERIMTDWGFETRAFHVLAQWSKDRPGVDPSGLYTEIKSFEPDLVIVGNLHASGSATGVLEMLSVNFSCMFYMHDMWLITGRCAYNKGCDKFLRLCDDRCPTYDEYPQEPPELISTFHRRKTKLRSLSDFNVLANSEWMAGRVMEAERARYPSGVGGSRAPMVLTPPSDIAKFLKVDRKLARQSLGLEPSAHIILCSATDFGDARKGYAFLLDAIEALNRSGVDTTILFVGWAEEDVRRRLSKHPNCVFLGYVRPERVETVYGAADLLLSAAIDEAFGMVYVEAAAAGVYTVAFRSGGVPEAVRHGVSGHLVDQFDGAALAEATLSALKRKEAGEPLSVTPRLWAAAQQSDAAVMRRFMLQLIEGPAQLGQVPPRTQLRRGVRLDEYFDAPSPTEDLALRRSVFIAGLGDVEYLIRADRPAPNYRILFMTFRYKSRAVPSDEKSLVQSVSFKLHATGFGTFLDLRPRGANPPLYERAMVELGGPFLSDDWGPTLWLRLGDESELAAVRACLPSAESLGLSEFAGVVASVLRTQVVTRHLTTVAARLGFPLTSEPIIQAFDLVASALDVGRDANANLPADAFTN